MSSFLDDVIQFNTWANSKTVDSLKLCPDVPLKGVELLSHILQNNWYVLDLIEGKDATRWYGAVDYTLDECDTEIPKIDAAYRALISGKSEDELNSQVTFIDFAGNQVTRRIADLIFHTFDHCTYHRGQIAMIVRQAGGEPAQTWFNRWIRDTNRGVGAPAAGAAAQ